MFDAVDKLELTTGAPLEENEIRSAALEMMPEFLDDNWTWRR